MSNVTLILPITICLCHFCVAVLRYHDHDLCEPLTNRDRFSRARLIEKSAMISSVLLTSFKCIANDLRIVTTPISLEQAVDRIKSDSSLLLSSCKISGRLLYRGEKQVTGSSPVVMKGDFDLLRPSTFSSNGFAAVDYFKAIESSSSFKDVRPSRSHIATSCLSAASLWGPVCSVWPLGVTHFAWLRSYETIWCDEWATPQSTDREIAFWRNDAFFKRFLHEEVSVDESLDVALSAQKEVMFSSERESYLAIPLRQEAELLRLLDIDPYDPSISVVTAKAMEVEGIVKRQYLMR